jgi:hypothetical protein
MRGSSSANVFVETVEVDEFLQRECLLVYLRTRAIGFGRAGELGEFKTACNDFAHSDLGTEDLEGLELYSLAQQRDKDQRHPERHEE